MDNSPLNNDNKSWLIPVIISLLISIFSVIYAYGSHANQIEINTQALEKKVDRTEFAIICRQLDRIETKIDNHMDKDYNGK